MNDIVEFSTEFSIDDTSTRQNQLIIRQWSTDRHANAFDLDFDGDAFMRSPSLSFSDLSISYSQRESLSSCRSVSCGELPLPFDLYEFVDVTCIDPIVDHIKEFLSCGEYTQQDWFRVLHRNNKELLRFFSLHADRITESRMTDFCECLLIFLEINIDVFSPVLVTRPFLTRLFQCLAPRKLATMDTFSRLQVLNILYENGGNAFPMLDLRLYAPLLSLTTQEDEQISLLARRTLLYLYFRNPSRSLWNLCRQYFARTFSKNHLISSSKDLDVSKDMIALCLEAIRQCKATEESHASCAWIQACLTNTPTAFFRQQNYFVVVDILLTHTPKVLYNENAVCWYVDTFSAILNWPVFKQQPYKSEAIFQLFNFLLEQGQERSFAIMCEKVSEVVNENFMQGLNQETEAELCIFE